MDFKKITVGFVIQTYRDGKCIGQEFITGNQVDWENEKGESIPYQKDYEYHCFDMVQPKNPNRENLIAKHRDPTHRVKEGETIPNHREIHICMLDPLRDPDTLTLGEIDGWCEDRGQELTIIGRIKSVRELTNLGLKESKDLVDSLIQEGRK